MNDDNYEHECDDDCYHHSISRRAFAQLQSSLKKIECEEVTYCYHQDHYADFSSARMSSRVVTITEMDFRYREMSRKLKDERVLIERGRCPKH